MGEVHLLPPRRAVIFAPVALLATIATCVVVQLILPDVPLLPLSVRLALLPTFAGPRLGAALTALLLPIAHLPLLFSEQQLASHRRLVFIITASLDHSPVASDFFN
jgi:hypothetical protein